jgi:hypothetical protein
MGCVRRFGAVSPFKGTMNYRIINWTRSKIRLWKKRKKLFLLAETIRTVDTEFPLSVSAFWETGKSMNPNTWDPAKLPGINGFHVSVVFAFPYVSSVFSKN